MSKLVEVKHACHQFKLVSMGKMGNCEVLSNCSWFIIIVQFLFVAN